MSKGYRKDLDYILAVLTQIVSIVLFVCLTKIIIGCENISSREIGIAIPILAIDLGSIFFVFNKEARKIKNYYINNL